MAHVSENKKKVVEEFVELIDKFPVVGVVNMSNLPTKTVQQMRAKLRAEGTVLRMTKKRLMKLAFEKAKKPKIAKLMEHFKGSPALIFTEDNPFKLYADLERNKSNAPAKAGQEAPKDIKVKAGPTSFSPGPVIGQLGKYGIKTGVEAGKLVIKEDAVAAKKGDIINAELAGILIRLGIEPMEIGLDLTAAYENGEILTSEILYVDEQEYMQKFSTSYNDSLNLAIFIGYPTSDTIKILLSKVGAESRALALNANILTDETAADVIRNAHAESLSIKALVPDVPTEEPKIEEKPAEPVKEEKPEAVEEDKVKEEKPTQEVKEEPVAEKKKIEELPATEVEEEKVTEEIVKEEKPTEEVKPVEEKAEEQKEESAETQDSTPEQVPEEQEQEKKEEE